MSGRYGNFKRKEKIRINKKNKARKNSGMKVDKKERRKRGRNGEDQNNSHLLKMTQLGSI